MKPAFFVVVAFMIAVLTNGFLYSQIHYNVLVAPQASMTPIGVDAFASGGATVAEWGLATSAISNPATMRFQQMTAYVEFGKYSTSKWLADIDYNGQYLAPSYVSFGFPLGEAQVSAGYFKQLSHRLTIEDIEVTNLENPDGTSEFFDYKRKTDIHSFFGAVSISVSDFASVGLSGGINYVHFEQDLTSSKVRGNKIGAMFILGAVLTPTENLSIGTSLRYNSSIRFNVEFDENPLLGRNVLGNDSSDRFEKANNSANVQLPPIVEVGASWQIIPQLRLLGSAEFQNWTSSSEVDARNVWNIHTGAVFEATQFLSVRVGFFTQNNVREYNKEVLNQNFITTGIQLKFEGVAVSFAMMDSHVFEKSIQSARNTFFHEPFAQTYVSAGISVGL